MKKLFLLVALCASALSLNAGVVYVAPAGAGDGTSWESPLGNIQDAIKQAKLDETGQTDVWLKGGTYMLDSTIVLRDSVSLYGGFAGTETTIDERAKNSNDPWDFANLTIIDAQNKDIPCAKANKSGGYVQPLIVDGVVFQNGRALAANFDNGGGIRLNLNVTLQNSIVRNCYSDNAGGGVQMYPGGNMHGCLLENNRQETGSNGGGAVNLSTSTSGVEAYITNCVFRGNSTNVRGGAINCQGYTDYYIDACTFYNNYAVDAKGELTNGGAIHDYGSQKSHITNCVIFNNSGKQAIYLKANEFYNNTLVKNVGNLWIAAGISTGKVCNNIVWNCYTAADEATPTSIAGNVINGLTVLNNYTYNPVPDIKSWVLSTDPDVANSNVQFVSNTTNGDFTPTEGTDYGSKSLVGPHFRKLSNFSGAVLADDAETKAAQLAQLDSVDLHISTSSALLNAGTDSAFVEADRDGNHRPMGRRTDVGAYEALTITNTAKDPYTIAEAIELTQAGVALTDSVYVIGVVDSLQYSAKYKDVNVWINDGFNRMEFYAMYGFNRDSIDSEEDLAALVSVGDTLVAKGTLKYYAKGDIYELDKGCYAIEVRKNVNITYHTVKLHGKRLDVSYEYIDNYGDIQSEYLGGWIEDMELTIRHGLNVSVYESTSGHCDKFLGWSDGVTENSRTITITSDTTITSEVYTQTTTINVFGAGEGGLFYCNGEYLGDFSVTGSCDGFWLDIEARANDGYYFAGWSDGYPNSDRYIHVYSDTTITAIFKKYCTVTINGGAV
ncbi:MAG: choice-of-anchor Q domain-containing protein, partial [Paludibacteraceae bacterium]